MGEQSLHAKLSPSSAKRWLTCPASAAEAARSVSPDTDYSKDGTAAHWVHATWLLSGTPPAVGAVAPNGITITAEMVELVRGPVEWVKNYIANRAGGPATLLIEEKVQIGHPFFGLSPDACWGTTDLLIMATTELVVYDLKAGYVDVAVEDNKQLTMYAIGACEELGWLWPSIRFVIAQPQHGEPKEWVISRDDLLAEGERLKPKVLEAASPAARYVPEDSVDVCRYCPAAGTCRALQQESLALARAEFGDDPESVVAAVNHLTVEELGFLLSKADLVKAALAAAEEKVLKLIQVGQKVPGFKLVEGKKNRIWQDEATTEKVLKEKGIEPFEKKLISPAKAEKLTKDIDHLITTPRGNPVLAKENDKRPALAPHFEAVDCGNLLD